MTDEWLFVADYRTMTTRGEVYVYEKRPTGWEFTQRLSMRGEWAAAFGGSLAVEGDTLVIGQWGWGETSYGLGRVHVFELVGEEWVRIQQLLMPHLEHPGDHPYFGYSVALDGDVLAVGAPGVTYTDEEGHEHIAAGAVFVYERRNDEWIHAKSFRMPIIGAFLNDEMSTLGWAVDVSEDTVVAGAYGSDGGVIIYQRHDGDWVRSQLLLNPEPWTGSDSFGYDVSIDSGVLVVGSPRDGTRNFQWQTGHAYVYTRDTAGLWSLTHELRASNGTIGEPGGDHFGRALEIHEDLIVVGAPNTLEGGMSVGSVYLFRKHSSGWGPTETSELRASDRENGQDYFAYWLGTDLATDGKYVLAGAPGGRVGWKQTGKAYIKDLPREEPLDCRSADVTASLVVLGSAQHPEIDLEIAASGLEEQGLAIAMISNSYHRAPFGGDLTCLGDSWSVLTMERMHPGALLLHRVDLEDPRIRRYLGPGDTAYFQVAVRVPDARCPLRLTNVGKATLN